MYSCIDGITTVSLPNMDQVFRIQKAVILADNWTVVAANYKKKPGTQLMKLPPVPLGRIGGP